MEKMTLAQITKFILEDYKGRHPDDLVVLEFHAKLALHNCKNPLTPANWVYDSHRGDPTAFANPMVCASALEHLVATRSKRDEARRLSKEGKTPERFDPIDLTEIASRCEFPTRQSAWGALRENGFEIADVSIWCESIRFWYAKTPQLEAWMKTAYTANNDRKIATAKAS